MHQLKWFWNWNNLCCRNSWPNTSYLTAMIFWTLMTYVHCFAALVEYCIVLALTKTPYVRIVPSSFAKECSKKSKIWKKCEKIRETLFTFKQSSAKIPSIWRFFFDKKRAKIKLRDFDIFFESVSIQNLLGHPVRLWNTNCFHRLQRPGKKSLKHWNSGWKSLVQLSLLYVHLCTSSYALCKINL